MNKGEKLTIVGMIGAFTAGLTFDGPYWYVGLIIIAICMLIIATGWAIYHAQYANREFHREIRRIRAEAADQARQDNKDITFRNWMATKVTY